MKRSGATRRTALALAAVLLASCAPISPADQNPQGVGYGMINPSELQDLMEEEDLTLVNVHVPLEGNIPGTDLIIAYDEIQDHLDLLPQDLDAEIIIYCPSGSMGDTASQALVGLGYTNVSNLYGGYIPWQANALPLDE